MHGYGEKHQPDRSEYKGNYVRGVKEGIGWFKQSNGNTYTGEWKDNKIEGTVSECR